MACRSRALEQVHQGMSMSQNQHELLIVSDEELLSCWVELQVKEGKYRRLDADALYRWRDTGRMPHDSRSKELIWKVSEHTANNVGTGQSAVAVARLVKDFRGAGRYVEKTYNGTRYIIFKGYAGLRSIFTGTRYRADNPKILSMGIGRLGMRHAAMAGAGLTVVLAGAFRIIEYFLRDQATLTSLIGRLATDVVKISVAAGVGYLMGTAVATTMATGVITLGVVAGPLLASLIVGGLLSVFLESIDQNHELTDRLIAQMESVLESVAVIVRDPAYLACRAREKAVDALDAFVDSIVTQAAQMAQAELKRLIGPIFYPGWQNVPR